MRRLFMGVLGVLAGVLAQAEEVVAYGELGLWLGPDEILVAYGETNFALVVFRDLPPNPTDADIRAAIEAARMKDQECILRQVLGSADRYREFQRWAAGIGEQEVAESEFAGYSFAFGVEELFENKPEVLFTEVGIATGLPVKMDVAVTVKDGEDPKAVSSTKVSEMIEATTNVADWAMSRVEPQVIDRTEAVSTPVEFTVTPGDGESERAYLRVKTR